MPDTVNLIAIALGGALALAGTTVSQAFGLISGFVERRHRRDIVRREKLEQLVNAVSESLSWFQTFQESLTIEDVRAASPVRVVRPIATIPLLYFPRLTAPAADYVNCLIRFHHFGIDCFQPHSIATLGAQMTMAAGNSPEAKQRLDEPRMFRQRLDDAIAGEAKRYFHA